jgi:hypothetical protein
MGCFAVRGLNLTRNLMFPSRVKYSAPERRLGLIKRAHIPSDGTIGGLVGKLDVLRVECTTCARRGRYHVARLLEKLGSGYRLTDWLSERPADCPQKNCTGVTRACSAVMLDLVDLT